MIIIQLTFNQLTFNNQKYLLFWITLFEKKVTSQTDSITEL